MKFSSRRHKGAEKEGGVYSKVSENLPWDLSQEGYD